VAGYFLLEENILPTPVAGNKRGAQITFGAMNIIRIQSVILHLVVHLAPRHSNLSLNNSPVNHYLSSSVTFAVL